MIDQLHRLLELFLQILYVLSQLHFVRLVYLIMIIHFLQYNQSLFHFISKLLLLIYIHFFHDSWQIDYQLLLFDLKFNVNQFFLQFRDLLVQFIDSVVIFIDLFPIVDFPFIEISQLILNSSNPQLQLFIFLFQILNSVLIIPIILVLISILINLVFYFFYFIFIILMNILSLPINSSRFLNQLFDLTIKISQLLQHLFRFLFLFKIIQHPQYF